MDPKRLALTFGTDPFVKGICRDNAAALLKGLAKARALLKGFGLGIDALTGAAVIRGQAIDQASARPLEPPAFELGSNDEVLVGRSNIESRPITRRRCAVIIDTELVDHATPFIPG